MLTIDCLVCPFNVSFNTALCMVANFRYRQLCDQSSSSEKDKQNFPNPGQTFFVLLIQLIFYRIYVNKSPCVSRWILFDLFPSPLDPDFECMQVSSETSMHTHTAQKSRVKLAYSSFPQISS